MKRKLGGLRKVAEWPRSIPVIRRSVENDVSRDHTQVQDSRVLHTVMSCSVRSPDTRTSLNRKLQINQLNLIWDKGFCKLF